MWSEIDVCRGIFLSAIQEALKPLISMSSKEYVHIPRQIVVFNHLMINGWAKATFTY